MLFAIVIVALLLPSAFASLSCPCSRPGHAGKVVGFVAQNGTTNNVNLYTEYTPKLGETLNAWATKEISPAVVPIESLKITVYLEGEKLVNMTTDHNGWFSVEIAEPGRYDVYGGDSEMHFNVSESEESSYKDLPPPAEQTLTEGFGNDSEIGKPCTNKSDCMLPWSYAIRSSCPYDMRCREGKCEVFCPWNESIPEDLSGSNSTHEENNSYNASDQVLIDRVVDYSPQNTLIITLIAIAIAVAAITFVIKQKKCCQQRKSSGTSGKKQV